MVIRDKKGRFVKGNCPYRHPKGKRVSMGTEFQKDRIPHNYTGIGTPRIVQHIRYGSLVETTIEERTTKISRGRKYFGKKRTSYARWVVGLGNIPKGYVVYHKDRNRLNNLRENLEIISRSRLLNLNRENKTS